MWVRILARFGGALWGAFWVTFGYPLGHLGTPLGSFSVTLGSLWDTLGPLWALFGHLGLTFGSILTDFGTFVDLWAQKLVQEPEKTTFSLFWLHFFYFFFFCFFFFCFCFALLLLCFCSCSCFAARGEAEAVLNICCSGLLHYVLFFPVLFRAVMCYYVLLSSVLFCVCLSRC